MSDRHIDGHTSGDGMFWILAQTQPSSASGALSRGSEAAAPTGTTTGTLTGTPGAGPGAPAPAPTIPFGMLALVAGFMILMMVMTGGAQRREKKRLAGLLANLKRGDKVQTIGGVLGTVAEIRDDEVILKVDENANTRVRFTKTAIQQVLKPADGLTPASSDPKVEVKAGKGERIGA